MLVLYPIDACHNYELISNQVLDSNSVPVYGISITLRWSIFDSTTRDFRIEQLATIFSRYFVVRICWNDARNPVTKPTATDIVIKIAAITFGLTRLLLTSGKTLCAWCLGDNIHRKTNPMVSRISAKSPRANIPVPQVDSWTPLVGMFPSFVKACLREARTKAD